MYCIYSGENLKDEDMSIEHIIPLSLGGCNEFTIYVGKKINNDLGSSVDGKFCDDFLVKLHQIPYGNKGHSKKEQIFKARGKMEKHPVTLTISRNGIKIYDHFEKKYLDGSIKHKLDVSLFLNREIRFRFVAKVTLATGYYLFGDEFVKYADCESLRRLMLCEKIADEKLDLKVYDNLTVKRKQDESFEEFRSSVYKYIGGSIVHFGYGEENIVASVAINGKYIGMVNFRANTDKLPLDDPLHRVGCMLICKENQLIKKSFWQCVKEMNDDLKLVKVDDEVFVDE